MIATHGLSKRFGGVLAVDSIDLDVKDGERYGFLGPNGSGKTTTVRMLLGLIYATRGEIELLGRSVPKDVGAALREVGALVESPAAYPHLSAAANLSLLDAAGPRGHRMPARMRRRRIGEVLELVGLAGVGRRPVKAYSLGMRQRLGLASALLNQPRLLILDEPTNGLDPQGIQEIRQLLLRLNREGTTIFLSSHLLAEVEQVCTRVGVMDRGRLVAQESMDEVRAPTGRSLLQVDDAAAAVGLLGGQVVERDGDRLVVQGAGVPELTRRLVGAGIEVREAMPERGSLEDLVLRLTGPRFGPGRRARRRPSGWPVVIAVELRKLVRRPRTWITVFLLCLLPTIVAVFLAVSGIGPRPGQGPTLLSAVLSDGKLYPAAALGIVLPIFLPIAVSVVAGESVAGEAATGTLRYLLVRPVSRTRLLVAKLVSIVAFTLLAVLAVAASGYVVGVLVLGGAQQTSALTTVSGTTLTAGQLAVRTFLMIGYIAISMLGVASVSLFLSTLTDSALGAALGGLSVLIGSTVLVALDAAGSVRDWLPTRYWLAWVDLFRDPILWHDVGRGLLVQGVWIGVLLGLAWAGFSTRDIKS